MANAYASIEEFRPAVQDKTAYKENDDFMIKCLEYSSRFIDTETGRFFYEKDIEEYIDRYSVSENGYYITDDGTDIVMPVPIVTLNSIKEDGSALTENTDFRVYQHKISKNGTWTSDSFGTSSGITLDATVGYETTPPDIQMICIEIAKVISGMSERLSFDENGGSRIDILNSIPRWVLDKINQRRAIVV